jgi:NADPH:quinone reductase-like Zn-dependent oxidoreductase
MAQLYTLQYTSYAVCLFSCRPKPGQAQGTYAQYVAVDEGHLAALPATIPLDTAGGLPLVGLTAWQVGKRNVAALHVSKQCLVCM